MSNEVLVKRSYGSEVEYGITVPLDRQRFSVLELFPPGVMVYNKFLRNGAKMYLDYNSHPEYAAGECRTLRELIIHEFTGEKLITEAYVRPKVADIDDKRIISSLHKRTITPNGRESTGAHESYTTTVDIWDGADKEYYIDTLGTFNAIRTVFTGAGHPTGTQFSDDSYRLAQKIHTLEEQAGSQTTKDKPLVNTRPEHHNGGITHLKRFHNTPGDANISPRAIRMKFGTMSIVLRLLEHNIDVRDLTLANPLEAAFTVADGIEGMTKPLLLKNGKTITALELNKRFIAQARKLDERIGLPQEERDVLDDWQEVIDNLQQYAKTRDQMKELEWVDWYTKRDVCERFTDRRKRSDSDFANFLLLYDRTVDGIGVRLRNPGLQLSTDMPTPKELKDARDIPPEGRAELRGKIVEYITQHADIRTLVRNLNWDRIESHGRIRLFPPEIDYSQDEITQRLRNIFVKDEAIAA